MTETAKAIVELFSRLPDLTASDPEWQLVSRHWNGRLSVAAGPDSAVFTDTVAVFDVVDGSLRPSTRRVWADPGNITLRAPEEVWQGMLEAIPPPYLHCPMGAAYHGFEAGGHPETVAQYWPAVHRVVALLRHAASDVPVVPAP